MPKNSLEIVSHFSSSLAHLIHPPIPGGLATDAKESLVTGQKPATSHEQSAPGHRQEYTITSLFNRYFPGPTLSLIRKTAPAELHGPMREEMPKNSLEIVSHFSSSILNLIHPLIPGRLATETRESMVTGQKSFTSHEQSAPGHRRQEVHTPPTHGISGFSTPFSVFSRSIFFPGRKSVTPERQGISLFPRKNGVTHRPHEHRDASEMTPYPGSTGEAAMEDGYLHLYHRSPAATPYMWHSPGSNNEPGTVSAENANIYRTHPEIEHVTSTHTEIVKERVIEPESDLKPPQVTPQPPGIDVDRMADQICQLIERRARIERERRGL